MVQLPDFRILSPDVGVFLYYAGRDRKFMRTSRIEGRIFLDLPGFLADAQTFNSSERMIQTLYRADAVKRHLRDPVNRPRALAVPEYPAFLPTIDGRVDRSFSADLGNLKSMFIDLDVGDLVIMTPHDHYDPLLIGEVNAEWHPDQIMRLVEYGDNFLPYRSVNWLSHSLSRRDFPSKVAKRLQNRKAITKIDPDFYDSIFRLVYSAYVWGGTSKLDIFGPRYNSSDPTSNAEASFLIKYAVAYYCAFALGQIDAFNALSLEDAADQYFDPAIAIQIAQTFGSPGGYIAKLIGSGAALGVALVLGVALSDEAQTADHAQRSGIEQAMDIQQAHGGQIDLDLPGLGNSMRAGRTQELRERYGRKAKAKIGMTLQGDVPPEVEVRDGLR